MPTLFPAELLSKPAYVDLSAPALRPGVSGFRHPKGAAANGARNSTRAVNAKAGRATEAQKH
jgi:hypothetical protein